ncbi:MAG: GNAT family N-acetyltransferase [Anaerolineaceae bacterium]|nr:GNAT family N-acetyltransferase [Anaerolineaceae bacterium]
MVTYTDSLKGIIAEQLTGFFVGWPNPPSPDVHLRMLQGSYHVWLALDGERVVGFVSAISDGVLSAFIPTIEVLPDYQGQGIGSELMRRMLGSLSSLYSIDVICDEDVQPFYERLGMRPYSGMTHRNYDNQSGGGH